MTLSEMRGIKEPAHPEAAAEEQPHPGPRLYVTIGVLLAVGEAAEVTTFYLGLPQWPTAFVLVALMVVNFFLIVLWFMHLRFDSRWYSWLFGGGLVLATGLFLVVLGTLGAGLF